MQETVEAPAIQDCIRGNTCNEINSLIFLLSIKTFFCKDIGMQVFKNSE